MKLSKKIALFVLQIFFVTACGNGVKDNAEQILPIVDKAVNQKSSRFYANFQSYPEDINKLSIGIYDSDIGGLAILEEMLKCDFINNITGEDGSDGIPDFAGENFQYLLDKVNAPYADYLKEERYDYFRELVIRNFLFLLGNKYDYSNVISEDYGKKDRVKLIIMADNIASACALDDVEQLLKLSETNVGVIDVLGSTARALFKDIYGNISKDNSKTSRHGIGIVASPTVVSLNTFQNIVHKISDSLSVNVSLEMCSALGLVEAMLGNKDYIDITASSLRDCYKGPIMGNNIGNIRYDLLPVYNFNNADNGCLMAYKSGKITNIQLNSLENYVRFHIVSLVDNYKRSGASVPLSKIVLASAYSPLVVDICNTVIAELKNYMSGGKYIYRHLIPDTFSIITPSVCVARESAEYLMKNKILSLSTEDSHVRPFITVPVFGLDASRVDENGNFTYKFKYGRYYESEDDFIMEVPLTRRYFNEIDIEQIMNVLPVSYKYITESLTN